MTPRTMKVQTSDRHDTPVDISTDIRHTLHPGGYKFYKYRHQTDMKPRWIRIQTSDRHDTPVDTSTLSTGIRHTVHETPVDTSIGKDSNKRTQFVFLGS